MQERPWVPPESQAEEGAVHEEQAQVEEEHDHAENPQPVGSVRN